MNPEQNNLNPNNSSTQGNNGISNNQPSNNQNTNFNQPIFNYQSQPTDIYQQSTNQMNEQESTPQPMNTFDNGNVANLNLSTKPPKKNNLGIIIIAIVAIVVAGIVIGINLVSNNKKNSSDIKAPNKTENKTDGENIEDISITSSDIVALTSEGNLYYIGDEFSTFLDSGNEDYQELKKVASDVVDFYNNNAAVYYIDKESDLYYFGASYNSGSSSEIEKDYSNVKDIEVYMNFCGFVINNNNELYIKNNGYGFGYCGLNKTYDEFTKIADNVKNVFVENEYSGYINMSDELYVSISDATYTKISDNVKSVYSYGFTKFLFLTTNNELYVYNTNYYDDAAAVEIKLLRNDVAELGEGYFKTVSGEYNVISNSSELGLIKNESEILYESSENIYYGVLNAEDIKEILYYDCSVSYDFDSGKNNEQKKLIYISNADKLVLLDKDGKETLEYNTDNITKIFDFVIKKNLVD